MFVGVTALGLVGGRPDPEAVAVLYLLPVTATGWSLGRWGAVGATVLGLALAATWATRGPNALGPLGYLTLAVALAIPGWLAAARRSGWQARAADRSWFAMSNDLLVEASLDGYFTRLSEQWEHTFGWTRAELMARPFRELIHPDDLAATEIHAGALEKAPGTVSNFENRYLAKDGSWRWLLWSARSDGRRKYAVARDITVRKELEQQRHEQLREEGALARTDALTGLPNRRAWEEALAEAFDRASAGDQALSLAVIDLDEFKRFNDRYGHTSGDAMLRKAAEAWRSTLRSTDVLARYGGEEFAVLLPGCGIGAATQLLERLRVATPHPQTCSVGVTAWTLGDSPEDLVARADVALYEAKRKGRDRLAIASSPTSRRSS
ncbi:sensor domain-containing diguanylate cyclase [Acidiferrimicrobium sp. IK]|uniref:GGDEF domain-containing protein n=1 Tax=Acidiferrimicrobium sp. IK TaxID=2871700 RepID=UPI0021CB5D9C|nr:sensor domain-containing diguanylate cyclase [Acidiferrimicrobium sp. IK]